MSGVNVEKWKDEAEMGLKLPNLGDEIVADKSNYNSFDTGSANKAAYLQDHRFINECVVANRQKKLAQQNLDKACKVLRNAQQESINVLTKGHLQPNNVNKVFQVSSKDRRDLKESKRQRERKKAVEQKVKDLILFGNELASEDTPDTGNITYDICNAVSIEKSMELFGSYDPLKHANSGISHVKLKEHQRIPLQAQEPTIVAKVVQSLVDNEFVRKADAYANLKGVDSAIVKAGVNLSRSSSNAKRPVAEELRIWLAEQLAANNCPPCGPDFGRLQLFSACFSRVISEFKVFGPLLADIKHEYDTLVNVFATDQAELDMLRLKVQQLLNETDNRLLLKLEQQKIRHLENALRESQQAAEKLRNELIEKVALYASYLPASIYREKREADPLLQTLHFDKKIPAFAPGDDPISRLSIINEETKAVVVDLQKQLATVKLEKETEWVPKQMFQSLQNDFKSVNDKYAFLQLKNVELEASVQAKQADLIKIEQELKEKEDLYNFLLSEYKELAEQLENKDKNKG